MATNVEILSTKFTNANEIDSFFRKLDANDFLDWWNKNHSQQGAFGGKKNRGPLNVNKQWTDVWNNLDILFNKSEINLVEFLAINTIIINESSSFKPKSEYYGTSSHKGIAYTFSSIPGTKRSYNTLGTNKTAFELFNDPLYIQTHGHLPYSNYKNTTDTAWQGTSFPPGNLSAETVGGKPTFINEADFHKFRGRGFIQTTGRENYKKIIDFIINYKGQNKTINDIKSKWTSKVGNDKDKIATISTNKDWDNLFQKSDNIIANAAVWVHSSRTKYSWIKVSEDEYRLKTDVRNVAKKVAGGGASSYHDNFEDRVNQQIAQILGTDFTPVSEQAPNTSGANSSQSNTTDDGTDNVSNPSYSKQDGSMDAGDVGLPNVKGLKNFFKPNPNILPKEIKIDTGSSEAQSKQIADTLGYLPYVSYNGMQIENIDITSLSLSVEELMPIVSLTFTDRYGVMNDKKAPLDDSIITVFLNSRTTAVKSIFMDFKILNFSNSGDTYTIKGIADINYLFLEKIESFSKMTSFECVQEFAKKAGLGFNSNINSSNDKMSWINPGLSGRQFIKNVIENSYISDSSFIWCYIDPYYNINYIDVEEALRIDIKDSVSIKTMGLNNIKDFQVDDEVVKLRLTNDKSAKDSNNYFNKWSLINNSTGISLNNGYLRKVKFFDTNTMTFNIFDIDSITSEGDKTIILKGSPQDEAFFKEHVVTEYLGKIDTDNSHKNYNYAMAQNKQNITDLQKIALKIEMELPNFNLFRFQKVDIIISNEAKTPTHGLKNDRLSGEWLIIDIKYIQISGGFKQAVTLIKRELNLSEEELRNETPQTPPKDIKTAENTTNDTGEDENENDGNTNDVSNEENETENTPESDDSVNTEWDWELEWSNASEIDGFFNQYVSSGSGYSSWLLDSFSTDPLFNNITDNKIESKRWEKIWNNINTIYNKERVNAIEYLALNTLLLNIIGTSLKPYSEKLTLPEAFEKYNNNLQIGNKDAFTVFNNGNYNEYFNNNVFAPILENTTDTAWQGNTYPTNFSSETIERETSITDNKYITNADFYKFKKKGILPIVGRKEYLKVIDKISKYIGEDSMVLNIKDTWDKRISIDISRPTIANNNIKAYISSVKDWENMLLDNNINVVQLFSMNAFFESKENVHIFTSDRSEDKVLKSIENIAKLVKKSYPNLDVDKYIRQVKKQISTLDSAKNPNV